MPLFSLSGFSGGFASKLFSSLQPFSASGGTELTPGDGFKYHVFLSPGDFVIDSDTGHGAIQYLIVAAGGGGGSVGATYDRTVSWQGGSGGGGAGGVLTGTTNVTGTTTYPITVGSAGLSQGIITSPDYGKPNNSSYMFDPGNIGQRGNTGGDSSFNSMTALGGGGGGGWWGPGGSAAPDPSTRDGGPGGSGGGGGGQGGNVEYNGAPGTGTSGQGYGGGEGGDGAGSFPPNTVSGGGGGGAGGAGSDSPGTGFGGTGGPALAVPAFPAPAIESAIPAPVRSSWTPQVGPTGLYGAGGRGSLLGYNGTNYTGNGGDGDLGASGAPGSVGGHGIVIVKYPV